MLACASRAAAVLFIAFTLRAIADVSRVCLGDLRKRRPQAVLTTVHLCATNDNTTVVS